MNNYLDKLLKDASKEDLNKILPNQRKTNQATEEECKKFIDTLAINMGITETHAFIAFATLCLKGVCNKSAPGTMSVEIEDRQKNEKTEIKKSDLLYICNKICGHKFLRRLAVSMAKHICLFAESKNLEGDLAMRLNNLLTAKGEIRLNNKEKAWANSFCQEIDNLETLSSERLPKLLAEDYNQRFSKVKKSKPGPSPLKSNPNKGKNKEKEQVKKTSESLFSLKA